MSDPMYPCNCDEAQSSISCQCKNCAFHSADDRCYASSIHIGPSDAESSHETVCGTFRCK